MNICWCLLFSFSVCIENAAVVGALNWHANIRIWMCCVCVCLSICLPQHDSRCVAVHSLCVCVSMAWFLYLFYDHWNINSIVIENKSVCARWMKIIGSALTMLLVCSVFFYYRHCLKARFIDQIDLLKYTWITSQHIDLKRNTIYVFHFFF